MNTRVHQPDKYVLKSHQRDEEKVRKRLVNNDKDHWKP